MKRRRQWGGGTWRWPARADWVEVVPGAGRVRGGVPTRGSRGGCACALGWLRVRGGWSAPLPSLPAQAFLTLHSAVCCSCFIALSRSVAAAAEWAFSFRFVMAGYEYVSPEQLAGFDKYKVGEGELAVAPLPRAPAAPWRLRGRRGPCHLVSAAWRAGGRC